MKVQTMLNLERLLPHQRMLREKLLVPYDKFKMAGRVLFISRKLETIIAAMHPLATRCTFDPTRTEFYPCSLTLFAPCCHYTTTDQWTGHADADATGAQLRTLQGLVLRLMRGEVAKVESNWAQQLALKHNDFVTAKRWKAALPHMFICKDVALMFGTSAHTGITTFTHRYVYSPYGCTAV